MKKSILTIFTIVTSITIFAQSPFICTLGIFVQKSNTKSIRMDVSSYVSGIYLVRIESPGNIYYSKIIISE